MNEQFEQDRKNEKEFYAHINLFKLLILGELTQHNDEAFTLFNGLEMIEKLKKDMIEENINLFFECEEEKTLYDLFNELLMLQRQLSDIQYSRSTVLLNAFDDANNINYYLINNEEILKPTASTSEIFKKVLPFNIQEQMISNMQKKLGERK